MHKYYLGSHSLTELEGVHKNLYLLCQDGIKYTKQDFMVFDGVRTKEEQQELVDKGASKTLHSKHLTGEAVDLVPWIAHKARWELDGCIAIAQTIWCLARLYDIPLRWGGVWDRRFLDLNPTNLHQEIDDYIVRRRELNKKAFIDAVHYELV